MNKGKIEKRDIHGWIVLDKNIGQTSTEAVAAVKRLYRAKKAGHAGTLDPLASGVLPIALGEATKTVSFVMDSRKVYRFMVRWGIETDTDDADGRPLQTSPSRPSAESIGAILPSFTGAIDQIPPRYSALKIEGERAYDLAREGAEVVFSPRQVEVFRLVLVEIPDADHAVFEAECGKGTYVRALTRDFGRKLGCLGHIEQLRRIRVGSFDASLSIGCKELMQLTGSEGEEALQRVLMPVEAGLNALPALSVNRTDAQRLALGQPVFLRGRDAPILEGLVSISTQGALVALAEVEQGEIKPRRIFNLPR